MYEDAHLESDYESRQHGDMDFDSVESDWDDVDFDEFTDEELGFDDDGTSCCGDYHYADCPLRDSGTSGSEYDEDDFYENEGQ